MVHYFRKSDSIRAFQRKTWLRWYFRRRQTTFHHNLYANHTSRNPRLGGGYAGAADADHVAVVQFSNNVIYNWGFNGTYGGGFTFTNFMNNIEIAGPGTRDNVTNRVIDAGEATKLGGFYIAGNRINGKLTGLLNDSSDYVKFSGVQSGEQRRPLQPHHIFPRTVLELTMVLPIKHLIIMLRPA